MNDRRSLYVEPLLVDGMLIYDLCTCFTWSIGGDRFLLMSGLSPRGVFSMIENLRRGLALLDSSPSESRTCLCNCYVWNYTSDYLLDRILTCILSAIIKALAICYSVLTLTFGGEGLGTRTGGFFGRNASSGQ